jgi:hypothetical protein
MNTPYFVMYMSSCNFHLKNYSKKVIAPIISSMSKLLANFEFLEKINQGFLTKKKKLLDMSKKFPISIFFFGMILEFYIEMSEFFIVLWNLGHYFQ